MIHVNGTAYNPPLEIVLDVTGKMDVQLTGTIREAWDYVRDWVNTHELCLDSAGWSCVYRSNNPEAPACAIGAITDDRTLQTMPEEWTGKSIGAWRWMESSKKYVPLLRQFQTYHDEGGQPEIAERIEYELQNLERAL